jgi:hypothetical protein
LTDTEVRAARLYEPQAARHGALLLSGAVCGAQNHKIFTGFARNLAKWITGIR